MRRQICEGLELDDDRDRVDVDAVYRYLSEEAYWVPGRSRETIERLVRESTRVIAAYHGDRLVGFCRVVSDGASMAWLGDVFVLESHRDLQWYLGTRDAHELYAKFGFEPPNERTMVRPPREP